MKLAIAVARYCDAHHGILPGRDWKEQVARIDPSLSETICRKEDEWTIGYAVVPGTLGKKLEGLQPDTVLLVEYRSTEPIDVLKSVYDVGNVHFTDQAIAVTVQNVFEGGVRRKPLAEIGLLLGRQGVPGLK